MPTAVRTLIDAVNAGDTDAFLNTFDADGIVDDWGRQFRGYQAIKEWSDAEFIGAHCQLEVTSVQAHDTRTLVVAQVSSSGFNGRTTFTFELHGDAVAALRLTA